MDERRNIERKDFSYYMRLINSETKDLLGHLTDLSSGGFKLDSIEPENMEIIIRMMDNYGKKHQDQRIDKRRSNLW